MNISIHRASLAEQQQADSNSHSVWGKDESLENYLARCRSSVRRGRAQCWVLTVDDTVVSALGCHPLRFYVDGNTVEGFGIASVHTRDDMRKRGFAERLCVYVMEEQKRNHARVGLLFSDVHPGYYEKMGFTLLSQMSYDCRALPELMDSGQRVSLHSFEPLSEIDWLHAMYHDYHAEKSLALARDKRYWTYSIKANSDHFFGAVMQGNERVGYVRVAKADELWAIVECVITAEGREELLCHVHRQVAFLAQQEQISWLTSWQRPPHAIRPYYTTRKRSKAWPMIWVDSTNDIACTPIYISDYF